MRAMIAAIRGRRGVEDFAALRALCRAIGHFGVADGTIQYENGAAVRASQIVGLQGCAAGGAAFAAAMRADIGVFGHWLLAMRTVFGVVFLPQCGGLEGAC